VVRGLRTEEKGEVDDATAAITLLFVVSKLGLERRDFEIDMMLPTSVPRVSCCSMAIQVSGYTCCADAAYLNMLCVFKVFEEIVDMYIHLYQ
jgi:hypothetical protein